MNGNPQYGLWRAWVVTLELIAILAGTFGTFMPMKAILILGSGEVPGFFPDILAQAGSVAAAVFILTVSAAMGGLAYLCTKTVADIRVAKTIRNNGGTSLDHRDIRSVSPNGQGDSDPFAEFMVVLLFGLLLAWVSLPFLLGTAAWIGIALAWIKLAQKRTVQSGHNNSSTSFVGLEFSRMIRRSLLPSSIIISLVSLLISEPRLGVTGALLAIIVGRRFQIAVTRVASIPLTRSGSTSNAGLDETGNPANLAREQSLAAKLALPRAIDDLESLLVPRGIRLEECALITAPNARQQVTLVPTGSTSDRYFFWRLFGAKSRHIRALELVFRTSGAPVSLFPGEEVTQYDFGEVLVLEIACVDPLRDSIEVEDAEIRRWYRTLVEECTRSKEFQAWAQEHATPFPAEQLTEMLDAAQRTPGIHVGTFALLQEALPSITEELSRRPYCWVKSGDMQRSAFLRRVDGGLVVAAPQGWAVGQVGDSRKGRGKKERTMVDEEVTGAVDADAYELGDLARNREDIFRQLATGNYYGAIAPARKLLRISETMSL